MIFTVLGAVAELERSLIAERVRAGLPNARAKGKRLGRPRKGVDRSRIAALRRVGRSWAAIGQELGVGEGTVRRAARNQQDVPLDTERSRVRRMRSVPSSEGLQSPPSLLSEGDQFPRH